MQTPTKQVSRDLLNMTVYYPWQIMNIEERSLFHTISQLLLRYKVFCPKSNRKFGDLHHIYLSLNPNPNNTLLFWATSKSILRGHIISYIALKRKEAIFHFFSLYRALKHAQQTHTHNIPGHILRWLIWRLNTT